jgi:putative MATE family efflux protein
MGSRDYKKDLTNGPIVPLLVKLTWPMIFGMAGMVIFNMVDTFWVGRLGVNELAAIGFTFPVIMMIASLAMGLGIGTTSLISRMIVTESRKTIQQYSVDAINLSLVIIVVFVLVGQLTIEPLFRALGVGDDLLPLVKEYMVIWYWGMIFLVVPMVGNNIIRATGDTFRPGMIMVAAALVNLILDPFLIFGWGPFPEMGLRGAALATVISRAFGLIITVYILVWKEKLLGLYVPKFRHMLVTWKKILYVSGPAALGMMVTPLSMALITRLISTFGNESVAGFGVATRLESVGLLIIHALASVMTIFAGQNWGKKEYGRIRSGLRITGVFSLSWGVLLFVVSIFFAEPIAQIFTKDLAAIEVTASYMRIISFSYGFLGIMMTSLAMLNGINKPVLAMLTTMSRMFILYVPLAFLLSKLFDLEGIFWAAFIANIAAGILGAAFLNFRLKKAQTSEIM